MPDTGKPPNPFKALRPYTAEERETLFGRDGDLCLILDRLLSNRTTLLFAGSGVGKTSFLNAKVIPELKEADSTQFICYHSRWAEQEPLRSVRSSVATALRVSADLDGDDRSLRDIYERYAPARSILVLDQFEEVFQYHKDTDYFEAFLSGLAELIIGTREVRVVFSMREEFLGELSVFDNRIPDLFNNYYRLKNPTGKQATEIIALTCKSVGVKCEARGLADLLGDLLSVDVGRAHMPQSRVASPEPNGRKLRRDFVPPPYLQIACYRLWERFSPATAPSKRNQFLAWYAAGEAQAELDAYCHQKLAALPAKQREMAADAFSYLMTRQGAKMAYEITHLAEHMRVAEPLLRDTLNALSDPQVRILRRSAGPDGGIWFELYHDMYSPFISRWKSNFEKARQEQEEAARKAEAAEERRHARSWIISTLISLLLFGLPAGALAIMIFLRTAKPPTRWRGVIGTGLVWIVSWLVAFVIGWVGLSGLERAVPKLHWNWAIILIAMFLVVLPGLSGAGGALAFWRRAWRRQAARATT